MLPDMKQRTYRIQYTYCGDIMDPEATVTIGPATLIEAVSYVRFVASVFVKPVQIVSVQVSDDGESWEDVPDWAEQEEEYMCNLIERE